MRPKLLMPMFALLGLMFSPLLLAASDDSQQPIHIEADRAVIDESNGMMTYTGHVVLRQGDIELRADTVVVYAQNDDLKRITAEGNPVRFRQQRADQKEVKGTSQRMNYDAISKQVLLLGNAEFWQGGNRFSGNRIQYDPDAERVMASAGDDTKGQNKPPRVSVTLQPRKAKPTP